MLAVIGGKLHVNLRLVLIHAHLQESQVDISKTHFANLQCGGDPINLTVFKPSNKKENDSQYTTSIEHTLDEKTSSFLPPTTHTASSNVIVSSGNGHYIDGKCGTSTGYIELEEGTYYIIPSCYQEGLASSFHMYIFTTTTYNDRKVNIRKIFPT